MCAPLKENKDVPVEDTCPKGTRICGISISGNEADKIVEVEHVIPVAGTYVHDGRNLDPKIKRIKAPKESVAGEGGGLEVELHGGKWGKRKQMASIEFICDSKRTGNEGNEKAKDEPEGEEEVAGLTLGKELNVRKEGDDKETKDEDDDTKDEKNSLRFVSYGKSTEDDSVDVLKLQWLTKQVCLDNEDDDNKRSGWGFFTWFILIAFLGTATYLIFGSWLNYNRYGARGWDLLPHGDTIRDLPYLFREWVRKVIDTVQGSGSRGGYSAV
ncbi:putative autophagy-related protein 27 [Phaeomoniella chlamydospora]|uniref:Putative autophagy-related protein 27 n=1 Tax=Phaeomoniella chlamydospora TaxID=158046 RepID=A0A0G2EEQ1_PHACM|nr:putative autophagy-related protein 27 [Phaeomoniella chlamydospora]